MKNTKYKLTNVMGSVNSDLHELFIYELKGIIGAERHLIRALPEMAGATKSEELAEVFECHLTETENHITRLEQVFASIDVPVQSKECKVMEGLLEVGMDLMDEMKGSPALDAALIATAQKVEHYLIASYGTLCAWAERMGYDEAVELLDATLDEEKYADEMLTAIAENTVNEAGE